MPPATIDKATKFSISILITLISACTGGAFYLAGIRGEFVEFRKSMDRMERTMDKLATQSQADGRDLSTLRAKVDAIDARVRLLEAR